MSVIKRYAADPVLTSFGELLRAWRKRRRFSQLDLALEAEVSARHISFLETGRSRPSREMVLILSSVLEAPLPDRNVMLHAAGFAPAYRSEGLEGQDAAPVRRALRFLLARAQPYPAVVVDPGWNLLIANDAYARFAAWLSGAERPPPNPDKIHDAPPLRGSNLLLPLFDDSGLASSLRNFDEAASTMLAHLRRAARDEPRALETLERIGELAPAALPRPVDEPLPLVVPLVFERGGIRMSLFSTMTMLGTTTDTLLSSLRLETHFAVDDASDLALRRLTTEP